MLGCRRQLPRPSQCLAWCVCPGDHSVWRGVSAPAITVSGVVCLPRPSQCLPWCVCPGHHSVCRGVSAPAITVSGVAFINNSIVSGNFPTLWKLAKVIPIHYKGPTDNIGNYRPISVLCVLSKILQRHIHDRLNA